MADPIDAASSYRFGIALGDNLVGVFTGEINPSVDGFIAPLGSLYLRGGINGGSIWKKQGAADTAWTDLSGGGVSLISFNFTAGSVRNVSSEDYLEITLGVGSDTVPFVNPVHSEVIAMSLSTDGDETWRLMLKYYDEGLMAWVDTAAYLDVTNDCCAAQHSYTGVTFPAGARLALQVQNATGNISKPRGFAILRETIL